MTAPTLCGRSTRQVVDVFPAGLLQVADSAPWERWREHFGMPDATTEGRFKAELTIVQAEATMTRLKAHQLPERPVPDLPWPSMPANRHTFKSEPRTAESSYSTSSSLTRLGGLNVVLPIAFKLCSSAGRRCCSSSRWIADKLANVRSAAAVRSTNVRRRSFRSWRRTASPASTKRSVSSAALWC